MLEFAHAAAGAIIAYKIGSPVLALPLAFGSHFLVDLLPHWNFNLDEEKQKNGKIPPKIMIFMVFDSFLGLILGVSVAAKALPNQLKALTVLIGAFLAVLPDLLEAPFYFWNVQNKFINQLLKFQKNHQENIACWPGLAIQVLFVFWLFLLV